MKRNLFRFALGISLALVSAGGVLVWALSPQMPPSLYRPELKRDLTQEQRWQLDFELANEADRANAADRTELMQQFANELVEWIELSTDDASQQFTTFTLDGHPHLQVFTE